MKRTGPGRPPIDVESDSVPVHVQMSGKQYDAVYARARKDRVTVPERIRRDIHAAIDAEKKNSK
jgi:hypothetical protein